MSQTGARRLLVSVLIALTVVASGTVATRAQGKPELQLKAAMDKEVVDGDLKAAIEMYRKLTQSPDRAVRAKAWLRMGQCYEKLGNSEARNAYQSILRDLADQKDVAEQARIRLAALGARPSATPNAPSSRMLWTAPEDATIEKVSPDGRQIAYTRWNRTGSSADIFVHDLVSGVDRRVTASSEETKDVAESCIFSKDGTRLAHFWANGSWKTPELRVISLAGSGVPQPRRLLGDREDLKYVEPRDWSADGKWIAALLSRKDQTGQIALVAVADGSVRVLKETVPEGLNDMAFSPEGRYLAIDRYSDASRTRDIFLIALDTGREVPVVVHAADDGLVGWSREDGRLIFTSNRSGENDLWAQRVVDGTAQGAPQLLRPDVGNFRCLGIGTSATLYSWVDNNRASSEVRTGAFNFATGQWVSPPVDAHDFFRGSSLTPAMFPSPDWSPDGKSIAYVVGHGGPQYQVNRNPVIVVRAADTNDVRQIRPRVDSLMGAVLWTPDGNAFVAAGRDSNQQWAVWRIDARTGATSLVVPTGGMTYVLGWSPDGRRLRYFGFPKGILERDIASGEETTLLNAGLPSFVGVSPDGRTSFYLKSASSDAPALESALIERNLVSGQEREITSRTFASRTVGLSPDARLVVATLNDAATSSVSLVVIRVNGGDTRELMRAESKATSGPPGLPSLFPIFWAPDSQSFLANKDGASTPELWWVPVDGRGAKRVEVGLTGPGYVMSVRAHPDGRRIAFSIRHVEPFKPYQVWALENVLPRPARAAKGK
ncbi:MAG: hypothetical protein ACM3NQ_12905 [Bacteroidales bacterium]